MTIIRLVVAFWLMTLSTFAFGEEVEFCAYDTVYDVKSQGNVSIGAFYSAVRGANFVLIGERHGDEAHPLFARCVLYALSQTRPVALTLEMMRASDQERVDAYRSDEPENAGSLGASMRWWESGWPAWRIYEPLLQAAWITRSSVLGGDADAETGPEASSASASLLGPDFAIAAASWSASMAEAHCGLISGERADALGTHQVNRDWQMAAILASHDSTADMTQLLYAGRAHVRRDRAVARHLAKRSVDPQTILSIGLVAPPLDGQDQFIRETLTDSQGKFDYVVFIGAAETETACERLNRLGLGN